MRAGRLGWWALLPPAVLLALAAAVFPAGGTDDSYITYWAARSLARTGEILNYNGDRLEQSSSLLHTVVLAVGSRLTGASVPAVGVVVAPLGALATVVATMALARRVAPRTAVLAGGLAATSSYLAYWSFGGMETTLGAAALAVAVLACARVATGSTKRWDRAGAVAAIIATVLVRPEGAFVMGATLAGAAVVEGCRGRGPVGRRLLALAGITAVVFGAVVAARLAYFGAPFPNPVAAKSTDLDLAGGWRYLVGWWGSRYHLPLLVVAVAGGVVVLVRARDATATLACSALLAVTGFVVASGGDWMQGGRFLVPAIAFLAVLAAAAVDAVASLPRRVVLAGGLVVVQVAGVVSFAEHRSTAVPRWAESTFAVSAEVEERFAGYELANRVHRRNAAATVLADEVVERLLAGGVAPVRLSVTQAGLPMFVLFAEHGQDVSVIDRYNLVTDAFEACDDLLEPSSRGLGRLMAYDRWFAEADRCDVALPDVVIDFATIAEHPALAGRYTTVASVPESTNVATGPLAGVDATTAQFVAVRNDLLAAYGPPPPLPPP